MYERTPLRLLGSCWAVCEGVQHQLSVLTNKTPEGEGVRCVCSKYYRFWIPRSREMGSAGNLPDKPRGWFSMMRRLKIAILNRVFALFLACTIPPGVPWKAVVAHADVSPKGAWNRLRLSYQRGSSLQQRYSWSEIQRMSLSSNDVVCTADDDDFVIESQVLHSFRSLYSLPKLLWEYSKIK